MDIDGGGTSQLFCPPKFSASFGLFHMKSRITKWRREPNECNESVK